MIVCNKCNTVYEDYATYCNECEVDLPTNPDWGTNWADQIIKQQHSITNETDNQNIEQPDSISEISNNLISETKARIYKIEKELKKTKDAKEKEELELVLDFLNQQLVHHKEFNEKAIDLDEQLNEIKNRSERIKNNKYDFKRMFYGHGYDEELSTTRVVGTNITIGILIASFYGMWSDFIPIPQVIYTGKYLAIIFSIILTGLFSWAVSTGRWKTKTKSPLAQGLLIFTFIPLFFFAFLWLSFSQGLPSLYTRVFGTDYTEIFYMEKYKGSSRRTCDHRVKGEVMNGAFPNYICINESYYLKEPKHVRVKLTGKRTFLGFHVIHLYDYPE